MILELFDFQYKYNRHKADAKLQKNIQTTKYQFFRHFLQKKIASRDLNLTTCDLLLII